MRILAVSDSDSYLKWSHALLAAAPRTWLRHELVLRNVISPSTAQIHAATGTTVPTVSLPALVSRVRRLRPDAILLACTGPALEVVVDALHVAGLLGGRRPGRPVLVGGLPGITVPANDLALRFRRDCDLLIVHSQREMAEHRALAADLDLRLPVALARLPYLPARDPALDSVGRAGGGRDAVFAAQSLVPPRAEQRRAILAALAGMPEPWRPVVKVRAAAGERQAHNESLPYRDLEPDRRIVFRGGSMIDSLQDAGGFATVSSTAALEAIAMGVPGLILGDFGVDDSMINTVFEGSGLIGTLDDLRRGSFHRPAPEWLTANYFHDPAEDTWVDQLSAVVSGPRSRVRHRPMGSTMQRARRWARMGARPRR